MTEQEKVILQKYLEEYLEFSGGYEDGKLTEKAIRKGINVLILNDVVSEQEMLQELAKDYKLFFTVTRIEKILEDWLNDEINAWCK